MGLRQDILSDPVSVLELRQLIAVKPGTTVRSAIKLMHQHRLGCVVVVDDNNQPMGKFSERLLIKLLVTDPDALDQDISEHMASTWAIVKQSDPIAKVIECMEADKLRFVVVVDEHGHPVGITGQKGVMEYIAEHFPRQVKVQETEAKLYMDQREGA